MRNEWLSAHLPTSGTFSKSPLAWGLPPGVAVMGGDGARVLVTEPGEGGRGHAETWRLDWVSGLGANLFGHGHPKFSDWVARHVRLGTGHSLPHHLEASTAEQLAHVLGEHVPGWLTADLGVRFCKTGSEACAMAVRLARAATGKPWVLSFPDHYHGWHDWAISRTYPARGVEPRGAYYNYVKMANWGATDMSNFDGSRCAAVVFEVGLNLPDRKWLDGLMAWCRKEGVLLIADEVVTALRYGLGGACERYNIRPDLVCMGKALGNGLPVNALIGRREHMDWFARRDPVFCSSTHWGEAAGLAAASWVLDNFGEKEVNHLWNTGRQLIDSLTNAGWSVIGHPPRSLVTFEDEYQQAFFVQGMWERGLMMNRPNFPILAHTFKDVADTEAAAREVREELGSLSKEEVEERVDGKLPRLLFQNR